MEPAISQHTDSNSTAATTALIGFDKPCRLCGYNLRGLDRRGKCPECGGPIVLSTDGFYLAYSSVKWLRRIALGARFIQLGMTMMYSQLVIGLFLTITMDSVSDGWANLLDLLAGGTLFLTAILYFAGSWMVTTVDRNVPEPMQFRSSSRAARTLLASGVVLFVILIGVSRIDLIGSRLWAVFPLAGAACLASSLVCQLRYLSNLLDRLPDSSLAGSARGLMFYFLVAFSMQMVDGMAAIFIAGGNIALGCFFVMLTFLTLVVGIGYTLFIHDVARRLKKLAMSHNALEF